jgi:hypothetical protein
MRPRAISSRALLVGVGGSLTAAAAGFALVDDGVLPGRLALRRALGACDVGGPRRERRTGSDQVRILRVGCAPSRRRLRPRLPTGHPHEREPAGLLYLHGLGADHRDVAARRIGLPWILADRVRAGSPPMVLVGVDGGSSYWHRRARLREGRPLRGHDSRFPRAGAVGDDRRDQRRLSRSRVLAGCGVRADRAHGAPPRLTEQPGRR